VACGQEEESRRGHTLEVRVLCAVQIGAESGLCAQREDQWRCCSKAEAGQSSPRLRGQLTSAWPTVVRNVRALGRSEYVKSKGWANARHGRETSGVAGEAKLRETDDSVDDAIIFSTCLAFVAIFLPFLAKGWL
jgi:hypothetical protein